MEKQWVEDVTESPQFKYGLLHPYLNKFDFENETHVDDSEFYDSDDSIDDHRGVNTHQRIIKFLKQVRQSRGYDVDTTIPRSFGSPFRLVHDVELKNERFNTRVMRGLNHAMENINAESVEATGKSYEFVEFNKIVETNNFMFLFTFTARVKNAGGAVKTLQAMVYVPLFDEPELCEWRVKPALDVATGA